MNKKVRTLLSLLNSIVLEIKRRDLQPLQQHQLMPLLSHITLIDMDVREYFHGEGGLMVKNTKLCPEECKCGLYFKSFVDIVDNQEIKDNLNNNTVEWSIIDKAMDSFRQVLDKSRAVDGRNEKDAKFYKHFTKRIKYLNGRYSSLELPADEVFKALTEEPIFHGTSWNL